jgi:transcriptional regulator of NAD metabolism
LNVTERRASILNILKRAETPVAAKDLAARFHVSRQVIVQDMAVIRAVTTGIVSTCRGYTLQQSSGSCIREFKSCHREEDVAQELNLIVDYGGKVKNVSIKHRVYGRISAELDICSRQDVDEFLDLMREGKSTLLGSATGGYHYHLVEAGSEERLDLIGEQLENAGFLAPLSPWEQETETKGRG